MREDKNIASGIDETQLEALIQHYEDARADGLCHEGAWEVALAKLTSLRISPDLLQLLEAMLQ